MYLVFLGEMALLLLHVLETASGPFWKPKDATVVINSLL